MFIPGCIVAIALFIFTGNPHDPEESRVRDQDRARTMQGR